MDIENTLHEAEDLQLTGQHQINAIMGRPPGWMLRYGITLFGSITVLLLLLSWVIRYPDTIASRIMLTTEYPPIRVLTRVSGKIERLWVRDGDRVTKGDLLALLENPANFNHMQLLEQYLAEVGPIETPREFLTAHEPLNWTLGPLQEPYSAFTQHFKDYRHFLKTSNVFQKTETLGRKTAEIKRQNDLYQTQLGILEEEAALAQRNLERYRRLHDEGKLSSEQQVEEVQLVWLQKKRALEQIRSGIADNNIRLEEINLQLLELQQGYADSDNQRLLTIKEDIQRLTSSIAAWKQNYLMTAPVGGEISMIKTRVEQQFVAREEPVLIIVPPGGTGKVIGKAMMSMHNSGKVKPGMPVNIRLDAYPFREYGILKGVVRDIAEIPENDQYLISVLLSENLVTTYGKTLIFQQEMPGSGLVVTQDRRFIERLFDTIRSGIKN